MGYVESYVVTWDMIEEYGYDIAGWYDLYEETDDGFIVWGEDADDNGVPDFLGGQVIVTPPGSGDHTGI